MITWIRSFFGPPPEVKKLKDSLWIYSRKCGREVKFETLGGERLLKELTVEALEVGKKHRAQLREILNELGILGPQARVLVTMVAFDRVSSGSYHVYRGMLSPEGNDLKRILLWFINETENARTGAEDLTELKRAIEENIAKAG
ncbi:MAG: hypothetical protein ABF271_00320 [Abyssibacter sp.]|jgi:hypothetical protein|uniref:hypothetical protein n=1 Tax=Abyssibacter sp. TaxID=2320200 RepID=UPI00321AEE78